MEKILLFFNAIREFVTKIRAVLAINTQMRRDAVKSIVDRTSKYTESYIEELCAIKGSALVDGVTDLLNIATAYCRISNPVFIRFNEDMFCFIRDVRSFVADFSVSKDSLTSEDIRESYIYLSHCVKEIKQRILMALDLDASKAKNDYIPQRKILLPVTSPYYKHICEICNSIYVA